MAPDETPEDNLTEAQREGLEFHRYLMLWHNLAMKYLYVEPVSELGLAARLKRWQNLEAEEKGWLELEKEQRKLEARHPVFRQKRFRLPKNPHREAAKKLKAEILQALHDLDMNYLRRLWAALNRLHNGKVSKSPDIPGAALLAQAELYHELKDYPDAYQVRQRVELLRKEGGKDPWKISDKHWNERVLDKIGELFPKRAKRLS